MAGGGCSAQESPPFATRERLCPPKQEVLWGSFLGAFIVFIYLFTYVGSPLILKASTTSLTPTL